MAGTHYTPWERIRTVPETFTASPGVFSVQKNKERIPVCCTKHTPPQDINTGKDPETKHAAEALEVLVTRRRSLFFGSSHCSLDRGLFSLLHCHWIICTGQLQWGRAAGNMFKKTTQQEGIILIEMLFLHRLNICIKSELEHQCFLALKVLVDIFSYSVMIVMSPCVQSLC